MTSTDECWALDLPPQLQKKRAHWWSPLVAEASESKFFHNQWAIRPTHLFSQLLTALKLHTVFLSMWCLWNFLSRNYRLMKCIDPCLITILIKHETAQNDRMFENRGLKKIGAGQRSRSMALPKWITTSGDENVPNSSFRPNVQLVVDSELKQARFWDADGKRKWLVFPCNSSSRNHIYIAKSLFSIRDD